MYPCFEHPTLTDELNANGISWRYYTPSAGASGLPRMRSSTLGTEAPPPNG